MCEWCDIFNPFNSLKVLCWRDRFEEIKKGEIPNPVSVTVDSTNICNLSCSFCHYSRFRKEKHESVSEKDLMWLADVIPRLGAMSICYSGGGEPFVHPAAGRFIHRLKDNGLNVGTITNGVLIDDFLNDICYSCRWIGISIDAAFPHTYETIKGGTNEDFNRVLNNIVSLRNMRQNSRSPSIGFKFLIHPLNYYEIVDAAGLAKKFGADDFHARPCYNPGLEWKPEMVDVALGQIKTAQRLYNSDDYHVFGITHKFDDKFCKKVVDKCEVTPIAGLTFAADGYCYVCCDLRGEKMGRLCHWHDILNVWGSSKHKKVLEGLNPKKCPHRCTFNVYQEILDRVFRLDDMYYAFP